MSSLDLRRTAVLAKGAAKSYQKAFDILEEVQQQVRAMGIPDYPQPEGQPPPLGSLDPEKLTNQDLEVYYVAYVGYAQYIGPKVAAAEAAYKISTSNLKRVEADIENKLRVEGCPKAELKPRIREHVLWLEQEFEHVKLYCTKTILAAHYRSYSNQAKALSRVIELRKMELEGQQRGNNLNRRPVTPRVGAFVRPPRQ